MTTPSPSLQTQLAQFKTDFIARVDPQRVATMEEATALLRASGIEKTALKPGQRAPRLSLPNAKGHAVALDQLWAKGPVILAFYRGGWCPYCNLELRAWQALLPQIRAAGAQLVAISPQTPDNSLTTQEKNQLSFDVLSDSALQAAEAFGIAFDMPQALIDLYSRVGHDLPKTNGNGRWSLPVPATFVVNTQGQVIYAHVDADYRNRAEPSEVLAAIQASEHQSS